MSGFKLTAHKYKKKSLLSMEDFLIYLVKKKHICLLLKYWVTNLNTISAAHILQTLQASYTNFYKFFTLKNPST